MAMFWLILACVLVGIVTFIIAAGALELDIIGEAGGLASIILFILFIIPALSIASVIIARIIFKINFWIAVLTPVVAVLFFLLIIYIFSGLDIDELPTILVSLAVFLVLVSIIPYLKIIIQNNIMNWGLFVLACLSIGFVIGFIIAVMGSISGGVIIGFVYVALSIIIKTVFKMSFFWSACIPAILFLALGLVVKIIAFLLDLKEKKEKEKERLCHIDMVVDLLINTDLDILNEMCLLIYDYNDYENEMKNLDKKIKECEDRYKKVDSGFFSFLCGEEKSRIQNEIYFLENSKTEKYNRYWQRYENARNFVNNSIGLENLDFYFDNKDIIKNAVYDRRDYLNNEQVRRINEQKQAQYDAIQEENSRKEIADEISSKKETLERDISQLSDYIDILSVSVSKGKLPKVQVVSELNKILDSILDNKSYIEKKDFKKIHDDYTAFIKHVFDKCHNIEKFSGGIAETRINQGKSIFKKILK